MKATTLLALLILGVTCLVPPAIQSRPIDTRHHLAPSQTYVDVVGDVDGTMPTAAKASDDGFTIPKTTAIARRLTSFDMGT